MICGAVRRHAVVEDKPYEEWLKHPQWQKKRLLVMSSRGFACEKCGDAESELHVHHTYYRKGKKPWEYPWDCFKCLCEKCHRHEHGLGKPGRGEPDKSSWFQITDDNADWFLVQITRWWGYR